MHQYGSLRFWLSGYNFAGYFVCSSIHIQRHFEAWKCCHGYSVWRLHTYPRIYPPKDMQNSLIILAHPAGYFPNPIVASIHIPYPKSISGQSNRKPLYGPILLWIALTVSAPPHDKLNRNTRGRVCGEMLWIRNMVTRNVCCACMVEAHQTQKVNGE